MMMAMVDEDGDDEDDKTKVDDDGRGVKTKWTNVKSKTWTLSSCHQDLEEATMAITRIAKIQMIRSFYTLN